MSPATAQSADDAAPPALCNQVQVAMENIVQGIT